MSIRVGRYAGHVTITSSVTGRIAAVDHAEWVDLVATIKAGHLDYTLEPADPHMDLSSVLHERIITGEPGDGQCAITYPHSAHTWERRIPQRCPGLNRPGVTL